MRALIQTATIGVLALVACDSPVGLHTGSLALRTARVPGAASVAVDRGQVTLSGPTSATQSAKQGQKLAFDTLDPGMYTITVEAFSGGTIGELGITSGVSVAAGQPEQASVTVGRPVPPGTVLDQDVTMATTVTLNTSNPVPGLTYTWTQTSGPTGAWSGPWTGTAPSLTAPADVVTLQYQLVASNGNKSAPPVTATIWVLQDVAHALWVSPTGDDAHAGTRAAPMATIQAAMDAMAAASTTGGAVYVAAGTYAQSLTLHPKVSVFGGVGPTPFPRQYAPQSPRIHGGAAA